MENPKGSVGEVVAPAAPVIEDFPQKHGGHAHAHGDTEAVAGLAADLEDPQHE